jgi:hypothetical protein
LIVVEVETWLPCVVMVVVASPATLALSPEAECLPVAP